MADLTRQADAQWAKIAVLLLPTAGTTYKIADILSDPMRLDSSLGTYTNFANLMNLSAKRCLLDSGLTACRLASR